MQAWSTPFERIAQGSHGKTCLYFDAENDLSHHINMYALMQVHLIEITQQPQQAHFGC